MGSVVYFGNRQKQAYIPTPDVGMSWSTVKRSNLIALEGGGAYVDDSQASHREGVAEWAIQDPAAFRIVREFLDGVWGPGPFFWTDPFAADTNLLSPAWATPGIIANGDWPSIHTTRHVNTNWLGPSGILGVPGRAVTYAPTNDAAGTVPTRRFTILIPPGHKLAIGSYGSATGTGVIAVRPTLANGTQGAPATFAPLPFDGLTSFHATDLFPYSSGYRLVDIYLARTSAAVSTITLAGIVARVVREDQTLSTTGTPFISGEGAGALRFVGGVTETLHYAPRDPSRRAKGFSVKLAETGDWE